jgi:deoxyribodipyrimidine photo-lyase
MDDYPEANARHYAFMLEGLKEVAAALAARGVGFVLRKGSPPEVALGLRRDASVVVCDVGYTRFQRAWRERVAGEAGRSVVAVEGEVVVPVGLASPKAEIGARTLRPRSSGSRRVPGTRSRGAAAGLDPRPGRGGDLDPADVEGCLGALRLDRSVPRSARFRAAPPRPARGWAGSSRT